MKHISFVLHLTIACSLTGCSSPKASAWLGSKPTCALEAPVSVPSPDQASYGRLVQELYGYSIGADRTGRPASLQPDFLLPQLHPWFQVDRSYCETVSEGMKVVRIAKIPDQVIADLAVLSAGRVHGIGLLNDLFWRDVQRIQNAGLEASFFFNSGEHEFAGFYSADEQRIAFDVLANPGTPAHELRHHLQKEEVKTLKAEHRYHRDYAQRCAVAARRFFDELDANTFQMRSWIGALDFNEKELMAQPVRPVFLPQLELLQGYLNYPALAAGWVEKEDCPAPLKTVLGLIKSRAQKFQRQLVGSIGSYKRDSMVYLHDQRERTEARRKEIHDQREKIEKALLAESQVRPHYLRAVLFQLPPDNREFLSATSGGFKFLFELRGY